MSVWPLCFRVAFLVQHPNGCCSLPVCSQLFVVNQLDGLTAAHLKFSMTRNARSVRMKAHFDVDVGLGQIFQCLIVYKLGPIFG